MANFTQLTNNLNIISALATFPNEQDGLSATQLKAKFDEAAGLIKTFLNSTLIAELQAQGASAKLGAVVGGVASNLQAFINAVEAAGAGNLPPAGSVTNTMMATDVKIGSLAALTTTDKDSLTDAINELVTSIGNVTTPAGTVIHVAMSSAPTGYLKANGDAVSRVTYANLFNAIGTTYGAGNGSTTFNLPDLRGEFIRGWDDSRGIDNARNLGSAQADATKAHTHTGATDSDGNHKHINGVMHNNSGYVYDTVNIYSTYQNAPGGSSSSGKDSSYTSITGAHTHTFTTGSTGGTETRPRNVALLACIKY